MGIWGKLSNLFDKGMARKAERERAIRSQQSAQSGEQLLPGAEMSLVGHISELRKHIVRSLYWYIGLCCLGFVFMKPLMRFLQLPYTCYGFLLSEAEKAGESLQAAFQKFSAFMVWPRECMTLTAATASAAKTLKTIGLIEVMWVNFKMVMIVAAVVGAPFILRELWLFIAPALYERERKIATVLVVTSLALFYTGLFFGFFLILPAFLSQTLQFASEYAAVEMTYENYFSSLTTLVMMFGVIFEVPVIFSLLGLVGIVKPEHITKNRRIIFFMSFVIGAIISPPDVFSQIIVSVPLYMMCEISVFALRFIQRNRSGGTADSSNPPTAEGSP
ncbi:MAG: twin-arginine translocase subunit TatC [Proteobacteria bacterium]|nr:twin-arginine translocase subunit TatC [Pseudomonadota bacterium]